MAETFNLFITEKLQREAEIEAENESEAMETLENKYKEGEIVLDYSDLVDTEFSNCSYSKSEISILNQITNFCEKECSSSDCCPETNCILYRIEKIIENGYFESENCCICGKEIDGYGNNAEPVKEGKCCDECNMNVVIPSRLENIDK